MYHVQEIITAGIGDVATCCVRLPDDCARIIHTFLPTIVVERCFICGTPVLMLDRSGRTHYEKGIACTEALSMCADCFDTLYA